jgi:hypothetical protein
MLEKHDKAKGEDGEQNQPEGEDKQSPHVKKPGLIEKPRRKVAPGGIA